MTTPSFASKFDGSEPELVKMTDDQLMREQLDLQREISALAVKHNMLLLSAIHGMDPKSPDRAVEQLAKFLDLSPNAVWMSLRNDYSQKLAGPGMLQRRGTPEAREEYILQEVSALQRFSNTVLRFCGREPDMAYATRLLNEVEQLMLRRFRVLEVKTARREESRARETLPPSQRSKPRSDRAAALMPTVLELPEVVADAPGWNHKPDPLGADSVPEFVEMLGDLYIWAGEPSLRELARRTGGTGVAHSTFSVMLNSPNRLPGQRTVKLFVRALGCDERDVEQWVTAWRNLRFKRRHCKKPDSPRTA
ncbi:MAG TPA: hypothetical protein VFV01_20010 [Spirillospora sp.]|nr:hypothetical protein [Spirillospora sp.]